MCVNDELDDFLLHFISDKINIEMERKCCSQSTKQEKRDKRMFIDDDLCLLFICAGKILKLIFQL